LLLLEESERDNRLLSASHTDIHMEQYPTKKTPQLICEIKHAQWGKVEILKFNRLT